MLHYAIPPLSHLPKTPAGLHFHDCAKANRPQGPVVIAKKTPLFFVVAYLMEDAAEPSEMVRDSCSYGEGLQPTKSGPTHPDVPKRARLGKTLSSPRRLLVCTSTTAARRIGRKLPVVTAKKTPLYFVVAYLSGDLAEPSRVRTARGFNRPSQVQPIPMCQNAPGSEDLMIVPLDTSIKKRVGGLYLIDRTKNWEPPIHNDRVTQDGLTRTSTALHTSLLVPGGSSGAAGGRYRTVMAVSNTKTAVFLTNVSQHIEEPSTRA
eukprot:CAMPEP_0174912696 /NCGR_PEP_ID=MMETSP0167-20121228/79921_1 /TAXON_ID=38298 /ORGANISM="Rhodella maculata, Strain CCMP736" /LENGTH=261 /DNA_ID=CAMNT_0016157359 /DNA_START=329 /DNA_END=1115 /DNA_ORIENTATION=+